MPWSSNATFLVTMHCGDVEQQAICKPVRAERPLWTSSRVCTSVSAPHLLSEHLGVGVVPPTVIRDGLFGEGSFQWFVDADHAEHSLTIHEQYAASRPVARDRRARRWPTTRTASRALPARPRPRWAIDNGLCFSAPFKLRPSSGSSPASRSLLCYGAWSGSPTACRSTSPLPSWATTRSTPPVSAAARAHGRVPRRLLGTPLPVALGW